VSRRIIVEENMTLKIPNQYRDNEELSDAYRSGWNHGHGIACHNVPVLGQELRIEGLGRVTVDADNIREVHTALCMDAESNSRSYSPFEHTASGFNKAGEGGWRIYYDHDDTSEELYATREEAEAASKAEGWWGAEIVEVMSAEDLWEAFEDGTTTAILDDLAEYDDESYGIEQL
jgi:hypothetical protein